MSPRTSVPSSNEPTPDLSAAPVSPADEAADTPVPPPVTPVDDDTALPGLSIDDNPSLRAHVRASWRALPRRTRVAIGILVAAGAAWTGWTVYRGAVPPAPAERREAVARAEWAAIVRQSPDPLGDRLVRGTLGPGDAQAPDGRFVDFLEHTHADSAAFSVVVTSADFAPDVSVRRPDGHTVAASDLLRTGSRAEVSGLVGPGRFEITVTSAAPRGEGDYEVSVVPATAIDSLYAGDEPRADTLGGTRRAGRYERVYGVVAEPEQPVVIRVVSPAFQPRVSLLGPSGEVVEGWRSIERRQSGDSLFGVLLRYVPGWTGPYRLYVSSERPGAGGAYAIEAQPLVTPVLRTDGRGVTASLGDASWLVGPRYVDYYRFTARSGVRTTVRATSRELPPALRLWRSERQAPRAIATALNASGTADVEIEQSLDPGDYILEVTTGGADTTAAIGGEYSVTVSTEALAPPPPRPDAPGGPRGPRGVGRTFGSGVSRTGQSGGHQFEVGVSQVALSYPAGRTRVQLSVSVRSVDYTGNWAPWTSFVTKGYVVDDEGRRYSPSQSESASPSGPTAEPGTVRRGTVVFYAPGTFTGQTRFVYVASIGEGSVTLPIAVP